MTLRCLLLSLSFCLAGFTLRAEEVRVWRAVRGFTIHASFVSYEDGEVTLRRHDGQLVTVAFDRLTPRDREEVQRIVGEDALGSRPAGEQSMRDGRRDLTWRSVRGGDPWHPRMRTADRNALLRISRSWNHAETEHFRIHYQQTGFARAVARQADFFYEYIRADLPGMRDREQGKSSIVILRSQAEWRRFLEETEAVPEWAAAFVAGPVMFLQDMGANQSRQNTHILAHEMSHLVLNRFFARQPPLWLNEGLAEWYGHIAWKAFQGQRVNPRAELGTLARPLPLAQVMALEGYPDDPAVIRLFYQTSHHLVGFLMLEKDRPAFVRFLLRVTQDGVPAMEAIREEYGFENVEDLEATFRRFLR